MTTKRVGPTGAVAFLERRGMPNGDAHLFVSYMRTGLLFEATFNRGRYGICFAVDGERPLFDITARSLTRDEREAEAIARHVCPVMGCKAGATRRCQWPTGRLLKHPHPERVKLVKDPDP